MLNLQNELLAQCINERSFMTALNAFPRNDEGIRLRTEFINLLTPLDLIRTFVINPNSHPVEIGPVMNARLVANFNPNEVQRLRNIIVDANLHELHLIQAMNYSRWQEVKITLYQLPSEVLSQFSETLKAFFNAC